MKRLTVIKIGGNIIDDAGKLSAFLKDFAAIRGNKILVHGGGKLATRLAADLGVEQQLVDGRRITDAETLKIVTMVYAGYINKNIVAQLQALGCNAVGLCGADGNLVQARKRSHPAIDYGFVGDVVAVHTPLAEGLLAQGISPVLCPITHNSEGQLLNTNADTIAQEAAKAFSAGYEVQLVYSFEKAGVLMNAEDETTVIGAINRASYQQLKADGVIFAGMLPKLDNAFAALDSGVRKVTIGKAENLHGLLEGTSGTTIVHA